MPEAGIGAVGILAPGPALGALAITGATAIRTHAVRVTLSVPPLAQSVARDGDAFNPASWAVARLDTGAALPVRAILPGNVAPDTVLDRLAINDPLEWDVYVSSPLASSNVQHRVSLVGLRDAGGTPAAGVVTFDFPGLLDEGLATPDARLASRRQGQRDLLNVPTPRNPPGGTMVVGANGDYVTVEGPVLIRNLIFRRLFSRPGDFFHLPDYGVGLRVKETVLPADLPRLARLVESQVKREPEVEAARASLLLSASGVLTVKIAVRLRPTGQVTNLSFALPDAGVSL